MIHTLAHHLFHSRAFACTASLIVVGALAGCGKAPTAADAPKTQGAPTAASAPSPSPGAASPQATRADPARPVRTIRIAAAPTDDALILPGEVRPRHEQRLGFRVSGKVSKRLVEVGQVVKAGQTLAVMDAADVLPAIAAQRSQVAVARTDESLQVAELKRVRELRDQGFLSGAAFERQEALAQSATARVAAAQSQLAQVSNGLVFQTLRADQAGVVVGIDAEVGSVVGAGQTVVRVAQQGEIEVLVAVPERSVAALQAASSIKVFADAAPGKQYVAKLRELSPSADAASRTYAARLAVTNADAALRWGMSAAVRLVLSEKPVIVVPNSALYTRDATVRVWVVDSATQTVQAVPVTLGASRDEGVVIAQGLKGGETVVTAGANLLQPGQAVRVVNAPALSTP
jgi:membrane fusion protein, multidrug efflux system